MTLDLRQLIGKLGETPRRALEGAAGLALSRTHYEVELEHWLAKLLEADDGDVALVLRRFELDPDRVARAIDAALDRLRSGNQRRPDLTETIVDVARDAWVWCSVNYGLARVRSGGLLLATLHDARLRRRLVEIEPQVERVNPETLARDFVALVAGWGAATTGRLAPAALLWFAAIWQELQFP